VTDRTVLPDGEEQSCQGGAIDMTKSKAKPSLPYFDINATGTLLPAVEVVGSELSAIMLRGLWQDKSASDLAAHGLLMCRHQIPPNQGFHKNQSLGVLRLEAVTADGHTVIVLIWKDASAAVLRSSRPIGVNSTADDVFEVLPLVLRLAKTHTGDGELPALNLKVVQSSRGFPEIQALRKKRAKTVNVLPCDTQINKRVVDDILAEALIWAETIDRLPVLYAPASNLDNLPWGELTPQICADMGLDPASFVGKPYQCPNFIAFVAPSPSRTEQYKSFLRDIALWMLSEAPEHIVRLSLEVEAGPMAKNQSPRFYLTASAASPDKSDPHYKHELAAIFQQICRSDLAPISPDHLIGQILHTSDERQISSWLAHYHLAFSSAQRHNLTQSNHEKLALKKRFDRFKSLPEKDSQ